jgi:hypothetical protein
MEISGRRKISGGVSLAFCSDTWGSSPITWRSANWILSE